MLESSNRKLAKNTLYLYFRTFIVMGVSIYTSRIILDVLGVNDYGIYNVVGGFVSMFSLLSATLTAASQRFLAFELGKQDPNMSEIFSVVVTVHLLLALVVLISLETFGIWFVNCEMNIAPERIHAANWVFQCSVITFCINLMMIPYNSAIIAYERMDVFAYFSIFEVLLKLVLVFFLYCISSDALITYAQFMLIVAIVLRFFYSFYCNRFFKDCKYTVSINTVRLKQLAGFCGWNFIGSSSAILNGQGINILINLFFGVTYNASRGVAIQVDNAVNTFVSNFMMALNPQITKQYASENYQRVNEMIITGTKFAFFLFWIISFPIFINTDFILNVWLKEVPAYTALFVRLGIIFTMCQNLSQCLYVAMLATGDIKKYQIIVGGLSLLAFPMTYLFYIVGLPVEWGYWSVIIFSLICLIARLYLLQEMIPGFSFVVYLKDVCKPILFAIIPPVLFFYLYIMYIHVNISWYSFLIESIFSVFLCGVSIYFYGLSKSERLYLMCLLMSKIRKHAE